MSIKPEDKDLKYKTISEVFTVQYFIDFYQRDYTWAWDNVATLIEDVYYRFEMSYNADIILNPGSIQKNFKWYYLNTYIINKQGVRTCIVDGQQRFSSLTLILIKLYHLAQKQQLSDTRISNLKELICKSTVAGNIYWMGGDDRSKTFEDLFKHQRNTNEKRELTLSEKNLYDRYAKINNDLDERFNERSAHFLECFILYFLTMVKLVEIELKESDDVAMVFEVINAKGQKLKSHEILKAQLLSQIPKDEIDTYLHFWNTICTLLRIAGLTYPNIDDPIDAFFTYFFRARYSETLNELTGFKDYHKTIFSRGWQDRLPLKDPSFVMKFIKEDLMYYSTLITNLSVNNSANPNGDKHLFFNYNLNGLSNQYVLLLSAIKLYDPLEKTKISLITRLIDRHYTLLRLQGAYESNSFYKQLMNLALKVRDKANLQDIKSDFDEQFLEDISENKGNNVTDFISANFFRNTKLAGNNKQFIRYFFARIEEFLFEEIGGMGFLGYKDLVNGRAFHIEHILAQNEENKELFGNEDYFNEQRNRLGALLLLRQGDNNLSSDESYATKLNTYSNGPFLSRTLTLNFYHNNHGQRSFEAKYPSIKFRHIPPPFNEHCIDERQNLLFELTKTIWGDEYMLKGVNIMNNDQ